MKPILSSKINWLAIITAVLGIMLLPEFKAIVPITIVPYILLITSSLTFILRTFFPTLPVTQIAAGKTADLQK